MIKIFYFDENYKSNGENDILFPNEFGNYDIPDNATEVEPSAGLYQPIYFDVTKQKWVGTSKEQWQKENANKDVDVLPPTQNNGIGSDSELRKLFANMQIQLVQANMMVMQLSQQNARLSQEMVVINQKIEEVTNDGNVIPEV
ncbi:hypothetical protein JRU67_11750 [Mammaliicoccus sciuri]|uniref:Uncharacterized protein n=1 Tax=Mammaliicoccus sciuri TaxID=1296 RepID=A0AB37HNP4_MAMSC|nr:hypothetical protein [Mammaliicoccus sciuri]QRN90717.1 hypothetical protein JRU67_11750 [Mammaliicoccus sciuri]